MEILNIDSKNLSNILNLNNSYREKYFLNEGLYNEGIYLNQLEIYSDDKSIILEPGNSIQHSVHFEDVHFKTELGFGGIVFENNLSFLRCTFEEQFTVGVSIFRNDGSSNNNDITTFKNLYFKDCIFSNGFFILNGVFENFYTENCKFSTKSKLFDPFVTDLYIQGGYFKKGFALLGGEVENNIDINGGYFDNTLFFGKGIIVKSKISISNGYIKTIEVQNASINEFLIHNSYRRYLPEIKIGRSIRRFEIMSSSIGKSLLIGHIEFNYSPESVSIKKHCFIKSCSFKDYDSLSNSTVSCYDVIIENLNFINFNNYGKISFINLMSRKNSSTIISEYSNLGNIDFISCDLSNYKFIIDNTKIINLFYTSTKFPQQLESKKAGIERVRQLRDTYDQLQTVASKQGDRISSLKWQHSSLKYYFNSLTPFDRKWWILLSMLISNNFRMSSLLGLIFTLFFGLILYYIYFLYYTDQTIYNFGSSQTNSFNKYFQYYFDFINPTHKIEFIGKESKNPLITNLIDLISRIIVGFGIYQTIQAFRRYGKGD